MDAGAAPALDPRPTLRELDRVRRVAFVVTAPLFLIAAAFAWFGWNDAWLYGQDRVHHAQADVVARWFVPDPDRWWVRYTFADAAGTVHTIEQSLDAPPEHAVGERIAIVHWSSWVDGETRMEPVSRSDVLAGRIFHGVAAFTGGSALLILALLVRDQAWRRRLLREGERIAGRQPAVEQRRLPLGPGIEQWRLVLRYYDEEAFAWCDVRSDWQPAPAPRLHEGMALPPILRDPRRPRRTWIAAAGFGAAGR